MKKLLPVLFAAAALASCNDSAEKKETAAFKDTTTAATPETKTTTVPSTAAATVEVPKFADADVQKLADEYTAYAKEAATASADPAKAAEYQKKATEWAAKIQPVIQKLASKPEEMKKWSEYMQKLAVEMQPK